MIRKEGFRKSAKAILLFGGLSVLLFFVVIGLSFLLYASYYNDINLVDKRVVIADDEQHVLVIDGAEGLSFRYAIEEWRYAAEDIWDQHNFASSIKPSNFIKFHGVSPLPESDRDLIFSVTGTFNDEPVSLFTTLNIRSREISFFDEPIEGEIGNIIWSPEKNYFAYVVNDSNYGGVFLAVASTNDFKKIIQISKEDVFLEGTLEEYQPNFRMIQWNDDEESILFTVADLANEEEVVKMNLSIKDGEVEQINN